MKSYHAQTGETEHVGDERVWFYGLLAKKMNIADGVDITYCFDYEHRSDDPKTTIKVTEITDDPWDFNGDFSVIDDDGKELDVEQMVAIVLDSRPDFIKPDISCLMSV